MNVNFNHGVIIQRGWGRGVTSFLIKFALISRVVQMSSKITEKLKKLKEADPWYRKNSSFKNLCHCHTKRSIVGQDPTNPWYDIDYPYIFPRNLLVNLWKGQIINPYSWCHTKGRIGAVLPGNPSFDMTTTKIFRHISAWRGSLFPLIWLSYAELRQLCIQVTSYWRH